MIEGLLPSMLAGVVSGLLAAPIAAAVALLTVARTEWKKEMAVRKATAYTDMIRYIELSMDPDKHEVSRPERARIRNAFAVFGSPEAVEKFAVFRKTFMDRNGRSVSNSPLEWADVVSAMRKDIGLGPVDREHLKRTIDLLQ
jgi:hypothetical protein